MITISALRRYMNLPPDASDEIAEMCLNAAKSKAGCAGIPEFANNAQYDLFLCALATCYYDNRGMMFSGSYQATAEENARKLINGFALELRCAKEDDTT